MTALTATTAPQRTPYRLARAGLLVVAASAVLLALLDLFTGVPQHDRLVGAADYVFTADGFPLVLGLLAAVAALHSVQDGRDGRLGTIALIVTTIGALGFLPPLTVSLFSGDAESLGPVYLLSMLASLIGLVLFAISSVRAKVLPWWAGPVMAVGWVVGGPVGEDGPLGFRGSALLLAAAFVAVAVAVSRRPLATDANR
ncbi:hypothetical protein HC031_21745 [Planosporangium thailandense]|uniref:DUF998 domain-containing protein n=1 Tax=Planosporangium thailandense TaxID=765197 RepID=A0ABX0Y4T3_9ACTN|nr:hypothetical protein [Planosporangium thailandense]NJC72319.1 hypothetical protein [Planosporangium thailandense]